MRDAMLPDATDIAPLLRRAAHADAAPAALFFFFFFFFFFCRCSSRR